MNVIMCAESSLAFFISYGPLNKCHLFGGSAECMASYLSIWEWLPDPNPVLWSHSWLVEEQVARKKNIVFLW